MIVELEWAADFVCLMVVTWSCLELDWAGTDGARRRWVRPSVGDQSDQVRCDSSW